MKSKLMVISLIAALALAPTPILRADNPPPIASPNQECWIEIIGVIILIGIYYCNRYGGEIEKPDPPKPPKPPPHTNAPPVVIPPRTNSLPKVQLIPGPMCSTNITANGWLDTNAPVVNCVFTNQTSYWLQTSSDLSQWTDWIEVYQWKSSSGTLWSLSDGTNNVVAYNPQQMNWPTPPPGNFLRSVAK